MLKIAIVGAGVAGGVAARGLRDMPDIALTVVEQVAVDEHRNAGNGLNVGPNALKALDCVLPAVADELRAASLPWTQWQTWTAEGEPLYRIPLSEVADAMGIRIRWSELYRVARERIAEAVRFECACAGVAVDADGVRLSLSSGERLGPFDVVLGCDGRYSRLRQALVGTPPVRHLGVANFRLLIDDDGMSGIDDLEQWYNGPNRLLAFRLVDGRVYLSGNFPIEAGADIAEAAKTPEALRAAYTPAAEAAPRCAFLTDAACRDDAVLHWSRAQEIPTVFHDPGGRVLFLGDSAHAMVPTLGQGATQAIEDACAFLSLFRARYGGGLDVPAFTAAYDALRRARIEFARRFSWEASDSLLFGADAVECNRKRAGPDYRAKLARLYRDVALAR
jgi:salicylate hydroxylase